MSEQPKRTATPLPAPKLSGEMSVEEAIARRRSVREFAKKQLTLRQVSQLCWAAQGVTDRIDGGRAAPSAGALFPLETYVVTASGVDHYEADGHQLRPHVAGDIRPALQEASLDQESVGQAPVCFALIAVIQRRARKYGSRAEQYCLLEAGHVAQNILLQAEAIGLAGVPIGAFDDATVARVLALSRNERILYLLPIGEPR